MPSFLPPVLMELRANGSQAIAEMERVGASARAMADKAIAESKRELAAAKEAAQAARAAAAERAQAAEAAMRSQVEAEARTIEARKAAAAEEIQSIQRVNAALAESTMTAKEAAAEKAAAADRAALQISAAETREAEAARKSAAAQVEAASAAKTAQDAEARAATAATAASDAYAAKHAANGKTVVQASQTVASASLAAYAIIGVAALDQASKFEKATTLLVTSAGMSKAQLGAVRTGILQIAEDTGTSTDQLAAAEYKISSAGFTTASSLNILKAAAQGAKTEGADLDVVADALSSTLIDYHLKASDAADVTSKLVAATAAGKMRFQDLAAAMPAILPIASAVHVSLSDILGDMASMTVHGMSAQQSSENLADTIRHMINPTALQAKELALLGLTTNQLAGDLKSKGLSGTLQEISDRITHMMPPGEDKVILNMRTALNGLGQPVKDLAAHLFDGSMSMHEYTKAAMALDPVSAKQAQSFATLLGATHQIGAEQTTGAQVMQNYTQALAKATGDATGLKVALMLTGENAAQTNAAIKSIAEASTEAGGDVRGWAEVQSNFSTQLDKTKEAAQVLGIELGDKLLPVARDLLGGVTDLIHGYEKGEPTIRKFAAVLEWVAGAAVAIAVIKKTYDIGVAVRSMARDVADGASRFKTGFTQIEESSTKGADGVTRFGGAVRGALPALGRLATAGAAAMAVIESINAIDPTKVQNTAPSLESMTNSLIGATTAGGNFNDVFSKWDSSILNHGPSDVHNLSDAVGYLNDGWAQASQNMFGWGAKLIGQQSAMDQVVDRFHAMGQSLADTAKGGNLSAAQAEFLKVAEAFKAQGKNAQDALDVMPAYKDALTGIGNAAGATLTDQDRVNLALGNYTPELLKVVAGTNQYTDAAGNAHPITEDMAKSLEAVGINASGAVTDLDKFRQGLEALGGVQVSTREAQSRFNASLDAAKQYMKDFQAQGHAVGEGLNALHSDFDLTTESGRALDDKFLAVRQSGLDLANSVKGTGVDAQKQVQDALTGTYNNLITTANQMGITGDKADALARNVLGIPAEANIKTWMDDYAKKQLDELKQKADSVNGTTVTITTVMDTFQNLHAPEQVTGSNGIPAGHNANGGLIGGFPGFANGTPGGLLIGAGTGTSDSILSWLSNGEYVVRASMVQRYGVPFFDALNAGVVSPGPAGGAGPGAPSMGGQHVTVHAVTNATPQQIASEVGWALRNQN